MSVINGKYIGIVVENDFNLEDCPFKGAIKVVCAELFGIIPSQKVGLTYEENLSYLVESDWISPARLHPSDFYVPEKGEYVYIEGVEEDLEDLTWDACPIANDWKNLAVADEALQARESTNSQVKEITDRIIGTRSGHYIKFEDKVDGSLIIEVGGKNELDKERKGSSIKLNSKVGEESVNILAQNKDGSKKVSMDYNTATDELSLKNSTSTLSLVGGVITISQGTTSVVLDDEGITLSGPGASLWAPNFLMQCLFTGASHKIPTDVIKGDG